MTMRSLAIVTIVIPILALAGCADEAAETAVVDEQVQTQSAAQEVEKPVIVSGPERRILAFGDSLFAGYNLEDGEGYPEMLEKALRADGMNASIADAAVTGDTTAAGLQRFTFVLDAQAQTPEMVIVELGGNDLLRGLPPEETRANISAILTILQERNIPTLLMGMQAPPNFGADYVAQFDAIYTELSAQFGADLVPSFLLPVYGQEGLMLDDRIHPSADGVKLLVSETMDQVVASLPEAPQ